MRRLAAADRLSHAYIVSAPPGRHREDLVALLSAGYVCTGAGDKPCHSCPGCRKAAGGIHPDISRVTALEGKRDITVDQIRALRSDAYVRPNEGARKVYVVENAHTLNPSAQNALLKLLEDGPPYLAVLLVTQSPQLLLPTIRSRCETITLSPDGGGDSSAPEEDVLQAAEHLAQLLQNGDCRALAEYTAGLEGKKWDKERLLALLDATAENLHPVLLDQPGRILPMLEQIKRLREAALSNVGAGHLLGWLAAGTDHTIPSEDT